jgi:methylmalonyl-CoA mutase N-terminal domain/subunit
MVQAIERGYPQSEIQNAAYAAQRELEEKRSIVVGVNAFQQTEAPPRGLMRVDEGVQQNQVERLKLLRSRRNNEAVKRSLEALRVGALKRGENLIPLILDAVKAPATLGEISDTMRSVFGEYKEHVVL